MKNKLAIIFLLWLISIGINTTYSQEWDMTVNSSHTGRFCLATFNSDYTLLATGATDNYVIVWDFKSKKAVWKLSGHENAAIDLDFSKDSKLLASIGFRTTGNDEYNMFQFLYVVYIWDLEKGVLLKKIDIDKSSKKVRFIDHNRVFVYGGNQQYILDIESEKLHPSAMLDLPTKDGKYKTYVSDRFIEIYTLDGKEKLFGIVQENDIVHEIRISNDEDRIYYIGGDQIQYWDLNILVNKWPTTIKGYLQDFDLSGSNKYLSVVDYSGKLYIVSTQDFKIKHTVGFSDPILTARISLDEKYCYCGGYIKSIAEIDMKTGVIVNSKYRESTIFDLQIDNGNTMILEANDKGYTISNTTSLEPINHLGSSQGPQACVQFSPDSKYLVVGGDYDGCKIWEYPSTEVKKIGNFPQSLSRLTFSNDGKHLFTGDFMSRIQIWDYKRNKLVKEIPIHSSAITGIEQMRDGNLLCSSSKDGTIKLYDLKEDKLIATFLSSKNEWIVITPDGYFDSSPRGGELLSLVNQSKAYSVDQFAIKNNRPDIILKRLESKNTELITHFEALYKKRLKKLNISEVDMKGKTHLPECSIINHKVEGKLLLFDLKCTSKGYNLKQLNVYVNDVPIYGVQGKLINGEEVVIQENIDLNDGQNKVEVSCYNEKMTESLRDLLNIEIKQSTTKDLYLLAMGVSKYKNPSLNLQYAHKDALDLEKVIQAYKGKGFENVYTKVLTNEQVTPEAIKAAKDFVKDAKPDDTFILFIAGHGMHDKDAEATYYYLTSNADVNNLKATAADFETIEDLLQGIPPRNKLFLMDACESGEIDEDELETLQGFKTLEGLGIASRGFKSTTSQTTNNNQPSTKRSYLYQKDRYIYNDLVRRSGAIVFSSSKGGELSYERSDIENGLFTEYIMKALTTTVADKDGNGTVSTDELREYVIAQVAKSSGDLQHPTVDRDNIYQKFGFPIK